MRSKPNKNKLTMFLAAVLAILLALLVLAGIFVFASSGNKNNTPKESVTKTITKTVSKKLPHSTSQNNPNLNKNSDVIPSQFQGTWYQGSKKAITISGNSINQDAVTGTQKEVTQSSSPVRIDVKSGPQGSTILTNKTIMGTRGDDDWWISSLTINGKKETVLAENNSMGPGIFIFTTHPTDESYAGDGVDNVGKDNLDSVVNQANDSDSNDDSDSSSNSDNSSDSDNTSEEDDNNDNSDQDNSDDDSDESVMLTPSFIKDGISNVINWKGLF